MNTGNDCVSITFDDKTNDLIIGTSKGSILIYDFKNLTLKKTLTGHQHWVNCLTLDSSKNFLYSGGNDKKLNIWDIRNDFNLVKTIEDHSDHITSIIYIEQHIVSGGEDNMIFFYDVTNYEQVKKI